jgi:hypothetical protein
LQSRRSALAWRTIFGSQTTIGSRRGLKPAASSSDTDDRLAVSSDVFDASDGRTRRFSCDFDFDCDWPSAAGASGSDAGRLD